MSERVLSGDRGARVGDGRGGARASRRAAFAYSRLDALLVALSAAETGLLLYVGARFGSLSWPALAGLAAIKVFLNCTNYQCVAHNFIHNPFFGAAAANRVFAVLNTLALGIPQSLYKVHHLNHHRYGCDLKMEAGDEVKDFSSIYRFSRRPPRAEGLLSYAFIGPARADLRLLWAGARRMNLQGQVIWETAALALFWLALCGFGLGFFAFFHLPAWYLGQVAAHAENYQEHYLATPGSRLTDSVSCYNPLYNWLWFNNGYHQEHHLRPRVHWTRIKEVRARMLPPSRRRVVAIAHWFNR